MSRYEAYCALLALPDAPDLRGCRGLPRGRHYTQTRKPSPSREVVKRSLGLAYVQHRMQDLRASDGVVSVRRSFRIVERAG